MNDTRLLIIVQLFVRDEAVQVGFVFAQTAQVKGNLHFRLGKGNTAAAVLLIGNCNGGFQREGTHIKGLQQIVIFLLVTDEYQIAAIEFLADEGSPEAALRPDHKLAVFQIIDGKIMPSFNSIDGLGEKAADAIVEAAKDGPFLSKDDFRERTKASKTIVDLLDSLGILGNLPESNQISLFDFMA